jgi:hypothetical protein
MGNHDAQRALLGAFLVDAFAPDDPWSDHRQGAKDRLDYLSFVEALDRTDIHRLQARIVPAALQSEDGRISLLAWAD